LGPERFELSTFGLGLMARIELARNLSPTKPATLPVELRSHSSFVSNSPNTGAVRTRNLSIIPYTRWEESTMELQCDNCHQTFVRCKAEFDRDILHKFCSFDCYTTFINNDIRLQCTQCCKTFSRRRCEITGNRKSRNTRSDNVFCSRSCAATYNNLHKNHGTRRSKLEVWLEEQLRVRYPNLEILFNAKEAINAELDIHFPTLGLAFELNGIYHYEPIHGERKLASIQSNDYRKFAACAEKGISLCVIDVSTMTYFKPAKGQRFLEIITNIVEAG
jgi:hypothetical protein